MSKARTLRMEIPEEDFRKIDLRLSRMPILLQERMLKRALKEASQVFVTHVKKNIRAEKAKGRERWGKVSEYPLEESIRTRIGSHGKDEVGATVDIHAKAEVAARRTKQYAASMEYGHSMVVFGEPQEGRRVEQHPFWEPAKTSSQNFIGGIVFRELRRLEKEMVYGVK